LGFAFSFLRRFDQGRSCTHHPELGGDAVDREAGGKGARRAVDLDLRRAGRRLQERARGSARRAEGGAAEDDNGGAAGGGETRRGGGRAEERRAAAGGGAALAPEHGLGNRRARGQRRLEAPRAAGRVWQELEVERRSGGDARRARRDARRQVDDRDAAVAGEVEVEAGEAQRARAGELRRALRRGGRREGG
jgi:hypothetical protein